MRKSFILPVFLVFQSCVASAEPFADAKDLIQAFEARATPLGSEITLSGPEHVGGIVSLTMQKKPGGMLVGVFKLNSTWRSALAQHQWGVSVCQEQVSLEVAPIYHGSDATMGVNYVVPKECVNPYESEAESDKAVASLATRVVQAAISLLRST